MNAIQTHETVDDHTLIEDQPEVVMAPHDDRDTWQQNHATGEWYRTQARPQDDGHTFDAVAYMGRGQGWMDGTWWFYISAPDDPVRGNY